MKTLLIAAGMMMLSGVAAAQVNKCIDKNGKVVGYGMECPPGSRSEQMAIQKAPPATPAQQKSLAERDADFKKRQVETKEAEKKNAMKAADTENRRRACEQSQAYLKSLQGGNRITRTDPKTGERVFLQDNEYSGEMAKAKQAVDANCK
jgi:hypothetical protein